MQHSARFRLGWKNGLITAGILVLATALGLLFDWLDLQEVNLYALFLLGILLTAALTASRFCSAVSALAGILLFELLRAQPRFSLAFLRTLHPMDFLIPLGVALLMGSIAHNSRRLTDRTRLLLRADLRVEVHGDHCTEVFHFFRHHLTSSPQFASKQYPNKAK